MKVDFAIRSNVDCSERAMNSIEGQNMYRPDDLPSVDASLRNNISHYEGAEQEAATLL